MGKKIIRKYALFLYELQEADPGYGACMTENVMEVTVEFEHSEFPIWDSTWEIAFYKKAATELIRNNMVHLKSLKLIQESDQPILNKNK